MKKRVLAALLCTSMAATMFVGCGGGSNGDSNSKNSESESTSDKASEKDSESQKESEPADSANSENSEGGDVTLQELSPAAAEAIDAEPLYHFSLDGTDEGVQVVTQVTDTNGNTGATFGIAETTDSQQLITKGPVGDCTYFDGTYGLKLPMESINSNVYTISFWINIPSKMDPMTGEKVPKLGRYGATLQLGHNIGMNDADNTVTWINFTKAGDEWSLPNMYPVLWNRNSSTGLWPWSAAAGENKYTGVVNGLDEWIMVTLVSDGEQYDFTSADGTTTEPRIHSKLYINGCMVNDPLGEGMDGYSGMTPDLFKEEYGKFEAFLGVNYWDLIFEGYMDDVYVYNTALTDGQVTTLFEMGDPTVEAVPGEAGGASAGSETGSEAASESETGSEAGSESEAASESESE